MMHGQVLQTQWSQLSEFIAAAMGLHFPRERWDDLKRGLFGAAQEFGFDDTAACIDWLLSAPPTQAQLQVLASHLTVGETYFFRDPPMLEALAGSILPELIRRRRGREQRLRIWSAACCSGEEPYSLAILLHQLLPDLQDWDVTITASDINVNFLRKAVAGLYGEWSFRNAPAWFKLRYFNRCADGRYALVPEIRKLVSFACLNLVEDAYPSLASNTNAMDVVFCRNVLMYFTPHQVAKVIGNLSHALVEGGWLAVSPTEASQALYPRFSAVNFPGAILFQKNSASSPAQPVEVAVAPVPPFPVPVLEAPLPGILPADPDPTAWQPEPVAAEPLPSPLAGAQTLFEQGRYEEAADTLLAALTQRSPEPALLHLLARALANQGKLADALAWCERWIAADKLDPAGHYLRAIILQERGDPEQARASLQRAVYLQADFVLAHFSLGHLARSQGKTTEADRHFANALHLLQRYQPDDLLPESDGLSAGRLTETITALNALESVS
ncbi:CheR family methyltransferase [Polaromonas sp.]|uniref:CheR family methyltransferase n=1 Tax=Polaromonas sp. TaxID=1869339 RepID=UPI002FC61875